MIQGYLFSYRDIFLSAELLCVYIMLSRVFPGSCGSINILVYKATLAANPFRTRAVSVQGEKLEETSSLRFTAVCRMPGGGRGHR